ncbi:unnamed protein product [Adineta steineri]|uniref:NAD(P)(+)--arginine ADP-ribosyltransferase n=1 Tax=Adineta steineri TaxID=433720 RepID=A0A815K6J9_9BILA|nr:unnamed protein product [Adineta steineri]CAF4102632.1 unnamed protein product [Adineta steineri]
MSVTNRYSDISPIKRLSPVYGFQSQKAGLLEAALKPIEPQIDQLQYYIKTAKKYCHYPSEHNLTHDESASIYIYTMEWGATSLYRLLNQTLRNENRELIKIWFPYLKLFDSALDKLPTVREVVWRGVSNDIGKYFTKDQLITWWTVNSCSSSVNIIENFLRYNEKTTMFLIEAVNGKKISGYTAFKNEDEVVLKIGTEFRVKSNALNHPNGSYVVHLIEISDDQNPLPPPPQPNVPIISITPQPKSTSEKAKEYLCNSWFLREDIRISHYCNVIKLYKVSNVPESVYKHYMGEFHVLANIIEQIINADKYLKGLLQDDSEFFKYYKMSTNYLIHRSLYTSKIIWLSTNENYNTLRRNLAVCLSTFYASSLPSIITNVDQTKIFNQEYMKQISDGIAKVSSETEQ